MDEKSAAPILDNTERSGIDADHQHMARFVDSTAPGYRTVAEALLRYTREAPSLVSQRMHENKESLARQRADEAKELIE